MKLNNILWITIIVIIALVIIGLYALTEVSYFSAKYQTENNVESPIISIPSIGVFEKINNVSISQGVYHDSGSKDPTHGDVVLFGHRTLQGSVFLRLNELNSGDLVTLEWPGIGEVNYTINSSKVVPATYKLNLNDSYDSQHLYLITCTPLGSASERLIYTADLDSTGSLNGTAINENPHEGYAWFITLGFLALGLFVSYLSPKDNRKIILIAVSIITLVLIYFCLFPVSSEVWASQLGGLNSLMGVT